MQEYNLLPRWILKMMSNIEIAVPGKFVLYFYYIHLICSFWSHLKPHISYQAFLNILLMLVVNFPFEESFKTTKSMHWGHASVPLRLESDGPYWTTPAVVRIGTVQDRAIESIPMLCPQNTLWPEAAILMLASCFHCWEHSQITPLVIHMAKGEVPTSSTQNGPSQRWYRFASDLSRFEVVLEWPQVAHQMCPSSGS